MHFGLDIHPYSFFMIVSGLVSLTISTMAWFGTRKELARTFAIFQVGVFIWSLFEIGQWEAVTQAAGLEYLQMQFLGICIIPPSILLFAKALAKKPASRLESALQFLPALLFIALSSSNEVHHIFWYNDGDGSLPVDPKAGWGFWAFIVYAYVTCTWAVVIVLKVTAKARGVFEQWLKLFLMLLFFPFIVNILFIAIAHESSVFDPTPIAFAFSGLAIMRALRSYNLLDTVPYAKNVILESIDTPILVIDATGLIVGSNDEAMRIFPDSGGLEGLPVSTLSREFDGLGADGAQLRWSSGGVDYLVSSYVLKQGIVRWRSRLYLFRDISALVRTQRELEAAKERADAANAAKSAFVAAVSHELRNPLNSIIGLADLDLAADPPVQIREDLEVILSSGKLLLGLVNDLLDLSKIEAGRMEFESVDFDLREKAMSVLRVFRPVAEKKGVFLDIELEDGTPRYLRGDPLRYGQILMNLVSNALKFTEHGAVTIEIAPIAADPAHSGPRSIGLRSSVRDSGIGIAPDKLPRLFKEYSQADSSVSRRFGGTGLGLSICKKLVGLFGGEIEVSSVPSEGSVFTFTAYFELGDAAKVEVASHPEIAGASSKRLRVLVVDDEAINIAVARRYIERLGHVVIYASTGAEAVAMASKGGIDLVLLDLGLPDMDGFEVCRHIRIDTAALPGGEPPIAAMTGRVESGVRAACAQAGMIDCLSKPIVPDSLDELLAHVVAAARDLGPRAAATVQPPMVTVSPGSASAPAAPGSPLIDEPALLERLDGDEVFMRELLGILVDEAPERVVAFETARAAGDLDALQRLGHALKGSALSLCALPLGAAAGFIETSCVSAKKSLGSGPASHELPDAITRGLDELKSLLARTVEEARGMLGC
jgi:signal transduction histidine kinase/DNA-binding NarL/FixJ family response regulator/HPt (histidine-containing phosphotransfer) domain-containing protein